MCLEKLPSRRFGPTGRLNLLIFGGRGYLVLFRERVVDAAKFLLTTITGNALTDSIKAIKFIMQVLHQRAVIQRAACHTLHQLIGRKTLAVGMNTFAQPVEQCGKISLPKVLVECAGVLPGLLEELRSVEVPQRIRVESPIQKSNR